MVYRLVLLSDDVIVLDAAVADNAQEPACKFRPLSSFTHRADVIRSTVLLVCKQIRAETLSIYYLENEFGVFLVDWNSRPLLTWARRYAALVSLGCEDVKIRVTMIGKGAPHWENLLQWLKWCHSGDLLDGLDTPSFLEGLDTPSGILKDNRRYARMGSILQQDLQIALMFHTALTLKGISWCYVREILKEHHQILALLNSAWR